MIVIQNYKNTDNITSYMLRNHLSHEVFDIFFEDYIDCKSHTRHIIYSVCTKPVLKTTSKPKNNIQQKNNNNRLTETKDRKLKIIKTWSKYQIRRQYLLEQSFGHYKKAPKTYKWVTFQSQRSFRSNTNNSNNTRFNKNTRHNFLFYILKHETWNSYKFHSNQNFTKGINQRRSTAVNSSYLEMTDSVLKDEGTLFQRTRFIWKLLDLSGYVHKNQRRIWRKEFKFRINKLKCCYKRFLTEKK